MEISDDRKRMRTRSDPGKWSLAGAEPTSFSTLDASVPEFVPGQTFRVPVPQSSGAPPDSLQSRSSSSDPARADTADDPTTAVESEVSARLDEMSVSTVTAAEATHSEDASPAAAAAANVSESQDAAAIDRLNSPSLGDKPPGKNRSSNNYSLIFAAFHYSSVNYHYLGGLVA